MKERSLSVLLLGIALALNWVFLFTAFNYTTIANAVLVYYTAPVLATLISWRFLGEKLSRERMTLLGIAFAGFLIIFSGQKVSLENRDFLGVLFAFITAFFYALIPNLGRFHLNLLSAILYAFIVFGEVPGSRTVTGGALILLASALDLVKARGS